MLNYLAEVCLRVQQTLSLSLSHVLLALSYNCSPDMKKKAVFVTKNNLASEKNIE